MTRSHAALVSVFLATIAFTGPVRPASAQLLSIKTELRTGADSAVPRERFAGLTPEAWTRALAMGGRLPDHERMMIVSNVGRILTVVEGERDRVVLPPAIFEVLSRLPLNATLIHNHPDSVSLSGADLVQLAKIGVTRVVALGHNGTMYDASAASDFGQGDAVQYRYDLVLTRVIDRIARESRLTGANLDGLYPHIPHIAALVFDRADVIRYQVRPSVDTWMTLERYRNVIRRIVDTEGPRLRRELALNARAAN